MRQDTFWKFLPASSQPGKRARGSTALEYVIMLFSTAVGTAAILFYLGNQLSIPFMNLASAFRTGGGPSSIGGTGGVFSGDARPPSGNTGSQSVDEVPSTGDRSPRGGGVSASGSESLPATAAGDFKSRAAKSASLTVGIPEPEPDLRDERSLENVRVISTSDHISSMSGGFPFGGVSVHNDRSTFVIDSSSIREVEALSEDGTPTQQEDSVRWSSKRNVYQPVPVFNHSIDFLMLMLFMATFIFVFIRNRMHRDQI